MRFVVLTVLTLSLSAPLAPPVEKLSEDHQPFLADFEGSDGRARFVALLSPT